MRIMRSQCLSSKTMEEDPCIWPGMCTDMTCQRCMWVSGSWGGSSCLAQQRPVASGDARAGVLVQTQGIGLEGG